MATKTLRSIQHKVANFVFRNKRLLIGWHVWEEQRTEAWLTRILPSDATGEGNATELQGYHVYTSADGLEQLKNDIVGVDEVHPAVLLHPVEISTEAFINKGQQDRLKHLVERFRGVMRGRYKYCEREGGELRAVEKVKPLPRPDLDKKQKRKQSQKRKRNSFDPENLERDDSNEKRCRPSPHDDDDDEELPIKRESTDVNTMPQLTTVSEAIFPEVSHYGLSKEQPHDSIATAVPDVDSIETVGLSADGQTEQEHSSNALAKPDLLALTASAITEDRSARSHLQVGEVRQQPQARSHEICRRALHGARSWRDCDRQSKHFATRERLLRARRKSAARGAADLGRRHSEWHARGHDSHTQVLD